MSNYTVIHSTDKWLLARLSTDLMMEGIKDDREWNDMFNPFNNNVCKWISIMRTFGFHPHPCGISRTPLRLALTSRNYLQVLTTIIERHGNKI